MIAKIIKADSFSASLQYINKEDSIEIDRHALFSNNPLVQGKQMQAWALAGRTKSPVLHASLSAKPGENYTNEQWQTAARAWLREMGLDPNTSQYIVKMHVDEPQQHIHIIANRVKADGTTLSSSYERKRSHQAARVAEKAAGMEPFKKENTLDQGKAHELRQKIDKSLINAKGDYQKFKADLLKNGIEIRENIAKTGHVSGISFRDKEDHAYIKGSALGKEYGYKNIRYTLSQSKGHAQSTPGTNQQATGAAIKAIGKALTDTQPNQKRKQEMEL